MVSRRRAVAAVLWTIAVAALVVAVGCMSREDREFRIAVRPVLKEAGDLDSELGVWAMTPDALGREEARTTAAIQHFRSAIVSLPQPRERRLRYLRMSLLTLAGAASEMVAARINTLDALNSSALSRLASGAREMTQGWVEKRSQEQSQRERAYSAAMTVLVVAEGLGFGTNTVRDVLEAAMAGRDRAEADRGRKQRDSIYAETEGYVRSQIAGLR